ncbi:hypothetical protein TRIP_B50293 [uncultured Desulfatiglans sp.]|uniref:Uncharacterized protein n=1 Tax=Uncultured Desulfatiglans sp. TaxID=1748965 RepID=A0A653AH65_UNCDX|nr:hypothetical protein TRIP_B50293 [uncultured Desulfatiglans sp.]
MPSFYQKLSPQARGYPGRSTGVLLEHAVGLTAEALYNGFFLQGLSSESTDRRRGIRSSHMFESQTKKG